ncbi:MAG: carbohydrate-binding family 9-like protein [Acidobacteria bacterium]|nr:carbohydrate-binding family 9-like protein [Acidobacteriota bacterium]
MKHRKSMICLLGCLLVAWFSQNRLHAQNYRAQVIDESGPESIWGKSVGDLNGDGKIDLLAGGQRGGGLVWYENPSWTKRVIDSARKIGTDVEVADIDRDGKVDVIAITGDGLIWYKNPDWKAHTIEKDTLHDIEIADFDGDGDMDMAGRNQGAFAPSGGETLFFYRQESPNSWTRRTLSIPDGEGLKVADIDRDHDPDVIVNGAWYENSGDIMGSWPRHAYSTTWTHHNTYIDVGDINGDGRPDIVLSPSELKGQSYRISWFESPPSAKSGRWRENVIEADVEAVYHFVGVGDFNRDGALDVAAAEMQQGDDPDEVKIYINGGGGRRWTKQVIATAGSHSMRIADIDNDGYPDLFGANHQGHKVELWWNDNAPKKPALTQPEKYSEIEGLGTVPSYQVMTISERIVVDGRLSEKAWSRASPITLIFPWDFQQGKKQRTTVRLLRDKDHLYVGYDCEDTDITASYENRDDPVYKDDCVEIFIRPSEKSYSYYGLEMNARGVLYDYFYPFPEQHDKNLSLDGVQLKTSLRGTLNRRDDQDDGWSLELAIPFRNFSGSAGAPAPKTGEQWRVQINRWDGTDDAGRRLSMWCHSGLKRAHPHNPERFGRIVFK